MDYSAISGFILGEPYRKAIRIPCPTVTRYSFWLDRFVITELFGTMKPWKPGTGQSLKRVAYNGFLKTKNCSRKRSLNGKPNNTGHEAAKLLSVPN